MYDPKILLAILDEVEHRTKDKPIATADLKYDDHRYIKALHYLCDVNAFDYVEGTILIEGIGMEGVKLRYSLEKDIEQVRTLQLHTKALEVQMETLKAQKIASRWTALCAIVGTGALILSTATLLYTVYSTCR